MCEFVSARAVAAREAGVTPMQQAIAVLDSRTRAASAPLSAEGSVVLLTVYGFSMEFSTLVEMGTRVSTVTDLTDLSSPLVGRVG